ncbi:MAG: DGQHR domain-containing protein [Chloroflexota bacterium]
MTKTGLSLSDKQENDMIKFLKKLEFKDVHGGRDFVIGERQIDACAGHQKTLLIIECTNQKDISSKLDDFRGKIHDIREGFLNDKVFRKYTKHKFILAIGDQEITETINEKSKRGTQIYIWDEKFIEFHKTLWGAINKYAKYNLLSELDIKPEKEDPIVVPAFQAHVGKKNKYKLMSFFIEADKLMSMAFVARREMGGETFYQRMVAKNRLRVIADKYIDEYKVFPNSIIVALADNSWGFEPIQVQDKNGEVLEMPSWQVFGKLTIGNAYNSCWIIDGQHRLFSHALANIKGKLLVSAFANIEEEDQAEYFLDINREAKKVDPELLWDLLGVIKQGSSEGRISSAVKELRGLPGFFENNIKVPSLGLGRYSFNNLCDSLKKMEFGDEEIGSRRLEKRRNPFWDDEPRKHCKSLAQALNRYFSELDSTMKPEVREGIYSDGFLSVLIYIYKPLLVHLGKIPSGEDLKNFIIVLCSFFNSLSSEEVDDVRGRLTSEGNKSEYRNVLVKYLQEKYDPNFALGLYDVEQKMFDKIRDLEFNLNKFVYFYLAEKFGDDWYTKEEHFSNTVKMSQYKSRAAKENLRIWEVMDLNVIIQDVVLKPSHWDRYFKEIFTKYGFKTPDELKTMVSKMMDFRSHDAHKRETIKVISKSEKEFVNLTYKSLNALVKDES